MNEVKLICIKCGSVKKLRRDRCSATGISASCLKCSAVRMRQKRREDPAWNRAKNERWKTKNREKYLAHKTVENAIRAGKITKQPCQRCGATNLIHAHHDDYTRKLDVMWLCPIHHVERHKELTTPTAGG